ncbi:DUF4179 domain-containing protein [Bacillus sp. P14.5]|uniref:DUF4179 domain-containing protein n=1 Tax=Bacillus sp. P14.5 TaxID=1983400 RepID=UPI000DE9747A|nr:DUF4179 domain-containing protein [Bacillus sp. P14.5]
MNKPIIKFKEDIERIEIPEEELDLIISKTIYKSSNSNKRGKKIAYLSTAAVLFLTVLLGSGFVSPTMATVLSKIPLINSVLPYADDGLKAANEKGLVKSIGQTVEEDGVAITITDLYYDDSRLEIGYSIPLKVKDKEVLKQYKILGISDAEIYVDRKQVGYSSKATYQNDYITGIITIAGDELPKSSDLVNVKLDITDVLNKKGHWRFDLAAKKTEKEKIIIPKKDIKSGKYSFSIDSMELTPSSTKVKYVFSLPSNLNFNEQALTFKLIADNGEEMGLIKTGRILIDHRGSRLYLSSQIYFEPIEEDVKSITIIPVVKEEEGKDKSLSELEFVVPVSE